MLGKEHLLHLLLTFRNKGMYNDKVDLSFVLHAIKEVKKCYIKHYLLGVISYNYGLHLLKLWRG
jgi:hypothetical protein